MSRPAKNSTQVRDDFFKAAPLLSRSSSAAKLTPAYIAKVAGKPQKAFLAEFGNVEAYLSALQLQFFQRRLNEVVESLKSAKTGFDSIERALTAYLDYTLRQQETFGLLLEARGLFPALQAETQTRLLNSILMLQVELRGLGCKNSGQMARLGFAVVLEVVRMEHEAHARKPVLREALWSTLRGFIKL